LSPVDVGRDTCIFAEVFGADTRAVTGDAVVLRGGSFAEFVAGNEAAFHLIRAADVTLPAGGVTLLAVIFKRRIQRGAFFYAAASGFKSGLKATQRGVKIKIMRFSNIFVAGLAVAIGRVDNQTRVSQLFVFFLAVAAVADNAAYLTVGAQEEIRILDPDLFPYLQRRYITTSAFARGCL